MMQTKVLKPSHDAMMYASELLHRGSLVAFPTETVYGLGANALEESAVRSIFAAKGRPADNPLIVHIADRCQLSDFCLRIPPKAEVLMDNFWPGPLTLLFERTDVIPDVYDLATDRDAAKIADPRVRQHFVPKESLMVGVIDAEERGYTFQIYDRERMLVELLRYKSKLPFDLYKEILLNYRKIMPHMDIQKIQDYALAVPKSRMILNALQMEVL